MNVIIKSNGKDISMDVRYLYIYDKDNKQFRLLLNKFGELEIQGSDGRFSIEPRVSNEIILKQI